MQRWRLFKEWDRLVSSAYGLAVDEMLTHSIAFKSSVPILHLYRFKPSVIIGKYQDMHLVVKFDRCKELGYEWNRRSTGGGTVIMGPKVVALGFGISLKYPGMDRGIQSIFDILGGAIILALKHLGIDARFRPKNDIEVGGRKIAGLSAANEFGEALLFHTSLLVDFNVEEMLEIIHTPLEKIYDKGYSCFSERLTTIKRELDKEVEMEEIMLVIKRAFEETFKVEFAEDQMTEWELNKTKELEKEKYSSEEWLYSKKHPKIQGMERALRKTPGGLLEIGLVLSGNSIEYITITGDFFSSTEDINRIEGALKWSACEKESIIANLAEIWRENIIWGIDIETFAETILDAKRKILEKQKRDILKIK